MAQTPQQRAANAKFAKREEAKMGRPADYRARKETFSSPISKGWMIVLAFLIGGGLIFEILKLFF